MGSRIRNQIAARPPADLRFKAHEIEELADVHFFRPAGMVFARAARAAGLSPTAVTVIGGLVGAAGGVLLYDARFGLVGFALLILHGVLDSSDGQLARMTGRTTELGRLLDGVGGYVTHVALYLALLAAALAAGAPQAFVWWAILAGVSNIVHAQMYDYHRTTYAAYAIDGRVPARWTQPRHDTIGLVRVYEGMQRALGGRHEAVERVIAARATAGSVRPDDRALYRTTFYWPVRAWNFMGDNTRFYAIGVLALVGHLEWFFTWILVPTNIVFALAWAWQYRADGRFLRGL